jgi:hypothetical protein
MILSYDWANSLPTNYDGVDIATLVGVKGGEFSKSRLLLDCT